MIETSGCWVINTPEQPRDRWPQTQADLGGGRNDTLQHSTHGGEEEALSKGVRRKSEGAMSMGEKRPPKVGQAAPVWFFPLPSEFVFVLPI